MTVDCSSHCTVIKTWQLHVCTHFVACLLFHYCNEMNCRKGQLSSNEVQLHVVLLAVAAMCAAHCGVLASWHRSRSLINSCCALLRLSFACWCLPVPQTTSWLQLLRPLPPLHSSWSPACSWWLLGLSQHSWELICSTIYIMSSMNILPLPSWVPACPGYAPFNKLSWLIQL